MKTAEKASVTEKVIDKLRSAAIELEELRLHATLGKYEARDAYESSRRKVGKLIGQAKIRLRSAKELAKDKKTQILNTLEILEIQLNLGKAETKEAFAVQYQKILASLKKLEALINKDHRMDEFYAKLLQEIHKFRIRLEILKLQYSLNKLAVKEEYEYRKKDFTKKLVSIRKTLKV